MIERIGEGTDAVVYRAYDRRSGATVAIKALRVGAAHESQERLRLEFVRLAALRHRRLVAVRDLEVAGVADAPLREGQVFFTADHVAGPTAREHFAALPAEERVRAAGRLMGEVASALSAVHAAGLVHGDVKPDNILVGADGAVLCDLGLSRARNLAGEVAGTPAYLAPEALCGEIDSRSDLWSLGVTLWELVEGAPPWSDPAAELFQKILAAPLPPARCAGPDLVRVLARLIERDPSRRFSSAEAVEVEAARLSGDAVGAIEILARPRPLLSPALCGREHELARLVEVLGGRGAQARAIAVIGPPGVGKTRLVREAIRLVQARSVAGLAVPREILWSLPPLASAPIDDLGLAAARVLDVLAVGERAVTLCLRAGAGEPLCHRLAEALLCDVDEPRARLVVEADEEPAWARRAGATRIALEPLGAADGVRLLESMGGERLASQVDLVHASWGLPGLLEQLARARHEGLDPASVKGIGDLLGRRVASLPKGARRALEVLAVLARDVGADEVARVLGCAAAEAYAGLAALVALGLCHVEPEGYRPVSAAADAALGALGPRRRRDLHRAARALCAADAPARRRARHDEVLLGVDRAAPLAIQAGEEALAALALSEAARHFEFALQTRDASVRERAALLLADLRALGGDYDGALAALARGGSGPLGALKRGRLLLRAGRYDEADAALGPLLDAAGDARLEAAALLARIDLACGRPEAARSRCGEPAQLPATAGGRAALEAAGLARFRLGDPGGARACFLRLAEMEDGWGAGAPGSGARAQALLGMVAHDQGNLAEAASRYGDALAEAERVGDVHAQAMFAANLGAIDIERGRYGDALPRVALSARRLGRLGRTAEWAFSLLNHGNLLARLGDLPGAGEMLERARDAAQRVGADVEAYAASLDGDLLRSAGRPSAAGEAYRRAVAAADRLPGAGALRGEALVGLAAAEREMGRPDEAAAALARAATELHPPLGDVRVLIERARAQPSGAAGLADDLVRASARLREAGARDLLWRAELQLARHATGEAASAARDRARTIFEEVLMSTPDPYRDGLRRDPDARLLEELSTGAASLAAPHPPASRAGVAEARLRRLLAINKRLNSETRLPRLLEYIVDTTIELCDAERGFLVLVDDHGGFQVRTARNFTAQTIAADDFAMSRSIAEQAARSGQPIVTVDATSDARFAAKRSVSAMRLRSVLAAPLRVKGKLVGTLYVDHRLRRGAFSDEDVAMVLDFAEQAAIAIDNAHMASELRRQTREIDRIRRELQRRVEKREAEIEELRTEVVQHREALSSRPPYQGLVGRSAVMRALCALLDRVCATDLPVVICGESGTGKELVARALHAHGPRREHAFVSENCSAIPETLLESILFGHVRGAFTGADRDRRGLFEVADGGTLFLDEVGEMSPGMQAKLLRVLQDGEFRRVGGEQLLHARVRVVAASNRDLKKLVADARFREDLYYRLSVVRIDVPPLRDRREDIPMLCEHLLAKHFSPPRVIEADAVRALAAWRWPGNVRELENVLLRAAALGDGPIRLADLPAELQPGEARAADPDDLRIRQRVEDVERDLIRQALVRTQGNQSQAARLLGVSRFGLHKKMQRFRIRVAT